MSSSSLACITLAAIALLSHGSEFLKAKHVSENEIQASLLAEVEGTLGRGSSMSRLHVFEASLKPMYAALPKNEHGNLGHATVRYALHRLFILRHGWHIKGLGRDAVAQNTSSPTGVLKEQVPAYIQDMFEKRLGEKGLGLHDLAVLASTMEHLIHEEAVNKLGEIFNVQKMLPTEIVSAKKATELLDFFMMVYILGPEENTSRLSLRNAPKLIASWSDYKAFGRQVYTNITAMPQGSSNESTSVDFSTLAKVVEAVGENFGTFQDDECQDLKNTLMQIEVRGSGRARLADFYKPGILGNWQFQESVDYLRQLGALDESNPNDPLVILVNYLHSQTNCFGFSGYYSVCCKDECEGLFAHLEEKFRAPEATAAAIVASVEQLPSSTVNISRKVSPALLKRLEEIAAEHGGMVPLHGRLFAQWMHHAYPRECPFPHLSGTTSQQTDEEFEQATGSVAKASKREMLKFGSASRTRSSETEDEDEELLPWSPEEELFVVRVSPRPTEGSSRVPILRRVALVAVVASVAFGIVQTFITPNKSRGNLASDGKLVV